MDVCGLIMDLDPMSIVKYNYKCFLNLWNKNTYIIPQSSSLITIPRVFSFKYTKSYLIVNFTWIYFYKKLFDFGGHVRESYPTSLVILCDVNDRNVKEYIRICNLNHVISTHRSFELMQVTYESETKSLSKTIASFN